ncbi:two-component sensor histidine kinase [Flavobacterium faecale]|uniref:histidine kinase n=1 Tax=Flavobacterium faecale TaxID=1355330 RepID=A0A2S1LF91_9FLAO|nr:HAMP domain-containing sensor histidine kinase [Flavobacterium faecale]AWG22450.1 two-component sensor histidine kinase [Flavobacterium faecale]
MKPLSFKNKIAFYYLISTAILIFVVFFFIYTIVKQNVNSHLNNDILKEVKNHLNEISIKDGKFHLIHFEEWKEREHNTVDVNPVFIEFLDKDKKLITKSPNLKKHQLVFDNAKADTELFDAILVKAKIRQIQVPIVEKDAIIGYLVIAMSLEGTLVVLNDLSHILIVSYPLILLVLFLIARFIAGRSIQPINAIIRTSDKITKDNLSSRIPLPVNKDELFVLSDTINNLLNRIENAIAREKQFTSDASHELRTPLTVIKGTLEVLIRKERTEAEYHEKINYVISEVNRLNHLVDQLLLLARFEHQKQSVNIQSFDLRLVVKEIANRKNIENQNSRIQVRPGGSEASIIASDAYLLGIILNNILSNALKYSDSYSEVCIEIHSINQKIECHIIDLGIGMLAPDLEKIFQPFYRINNDAQTANKGIGLGLSIVKRLSDLLQINIMVESVENEGTVVKLIF